MAVLEAVGSVVGSGINAAASIYNTQQMNKANRELAEYGYQKDTEMWNKNNLYNSPEAQMSRLKQAGLNPNLVYGNGAVGNTSGQLPKYNAPEMKAPEVEFGIAEAIQTYQNTKTMEVQRNNIQKDTDLKNQEIALKTADIANREARTARDNFELQKAKNLEKYAYNVAEMNLKKMGNEIKAQDFQLNTKNPLDIEKLKAEISSTRAGKLLTDAQKNKLAEELKWLKSGFNNAPWWVKGLKNVIGENAEDYYTGKKGGNSSTKGNYLSNPIIYK